ncbi:MAG: heavy metal sensor histidine kinase [Pseudomonadota bacterium]
MIALLRTSLTLRLTLLFAGISTSVLLILGLLTGSLVQHHFEELDMTLIDGKVELLSHALQRVRTEDELRLLPEELEHALVGHEGLAVIVVAPDGRSLFQTEGASFPDNVLSGTSDRPATSHLWVDSSGRHFRGVGSRATTAIAGANPVILGVSIDMTQHDHFMESFEWALWSLVGLAALMSGLLGWVAAHRGLAPLHEISRRTASITADRLDERLPVEAIPRELAEVAKNLNEMLARLEISFHRLTDFSSDLAHELRTPISNVLTQTQVTLSRTRTLDAYQDVLASNAEEFERLSRMISDMLFLAKSDNALIVPDRENVDLSAEIGNVIEFYEPLLEEKSIELTFSGSAVASGDRLMLRRAVSNLLSNAIRHTHPNGQIALVLTPSDHGSIVLRMENSGDAIQASDLPRIFDRFYRVDASRQRFSDGAGLGLAITKAIVRAHGGEVAATSGNGRTSFVVTLPVC